MHKLDFNKLNDFLLDLDNKYDINSGACALVASIIAKYFEDNNINYKTKIYYYDDEYMCAWHYSLVVDNIEINPSTYEYQEYEYEITRIEDNWNSDKLYKVYNIIHDSSNYWRKHNKQKIEKLLNSYLNGDRN